MLFLSLNYKAASKFCFAIWLTSILQELDILTHLKEKLKTYTAVFRQVIVSLVQWACIFSQFLYYSFCSYDREQKVLSSKAGKRKADIRSLIFGSIWKKLCPRYIWYFSRGFRSPKCTFQYIAKILRWRITLISSSMYLFFSLWDHLMVPGDRMSGHKTHSNCICCN